MGGLGIINPVTEARAEYKSSIFMLSPLISSLRQSSHDTITNLMVDVDAMKQ